ncbi:MAG: polyphosphate kinase 2 family protein, partial [Cellulomonadaceae bacterium]|nr:polyphosphate kinase 2 family protein [Cellulomonadaceae bacterium]
MGSDNVNKLEKKWTVAPAQALRWKSGLDVRSMDCGATPGWTGGRDEATALVAARAEELSDLQERLFAEGRKGGSR